MSAEELVRLTASELIECFRRRETTPSEAVAALCDHIEAVEPAIGAIVTLGAEQARPRVIESDRRWREGVPRSLEGVPFGVKDHLHVRGLPTLGGPRPNAGGAPSTRSSVAVARLEAAGAIGLAKLHIEERHGGADSADAPRNPWALDHGVGGSSSGPAAAVAACELPVALGTDGLGSVRNPAAFVGLSALKPTFGRIPLEGASLVSVLGPMARSAADLAAFLRVMAGPDPEVPMSGAVGVGDLALEPWEKSTTRIGIPTQHFFNECDGEVRRSVLSAVDVLHGDGARPAECAFPNAELIPVIGALMLLVGRAAYPLEDDLAVVPTATALFAAVDYERALRARRIVQRDFAVAFESVDVIVMPGAPAAAPRLADDLFVIDGEEYLYGALGWSMPHANVTGLPAVNVCCGFTSAGLPISMQLVGRPYDEATLLRVAHRYQALTDFHRRVPPTLRREGPLPPRRPIDVSKWVPTGFYTRATNRLRDEDTQQWVGTVRSLTAREDREGMVRLIASSVRPALDRLAAVNDDLVRESSILAAICWLEDEGRARLGTA